MSIVPYKKRPQKAEAVHKRAFKKKPIPNNSSLERRVRKLERAPELKYKDFHNTTAPSTTGVAFSFFFISSGDDHDNRDGDQINLQYVNVKARYAVAAGTTAQAFRCMLVMDKQNNATGPVLLGTVDIAQGLLDNTTTSNVAICPKNFHTSDRYDVLYDQTFLSDPQDPTCERSYLIQKNFRFNGKKVKYSSSLGSTVAYLPSQDLFWVHFATANSVVSSDIAMRTWFSD